MITPDTSAPPALECSPVTYDDRILRLGREGVEVHFPYDAALVVEVKALKPKLYGGKGRGWVFPAEVPVLRRLALFARAHGFTVEDDVKELAKRLVAERRENLPASRAADAEFYVEGLGGELAPFQRAGAAYATRVKRCLIGDEMGLGKTVQAIATLRYLIALPAVVVVPASLKYNWEKEIRKWWPEVKVEILETRGQLLRSGPIITICSYDVIAAHVEALRARGVEAVVMDEAHFIKSSKTKRYAALQALVENVPVRLALTGTPVVNRPGDFIALLEWLGQLDALGGFAYFADRFCAAKQKSVGKTKNIAYCTREANGWAVRLRSTGEVKTVKPTEDAALRDVRKLNGWVWDFTGADNLHELQSKLRASCMIRRTKDQVLTELPAKRRVEIVLPLANKAEYMSARSDVLAYVAKKAAGDNAFRLSIAGKSDDEKLAAIFRQAQSAAERAEKCEDLVKTGVLRQIAAAGKVDAVRAWVADFLETGKSLLLFGVHLDVLKTIAREFHAPLLIGDTPGKAREKMVEDFQAGKTPLLVLNIQAGGVGLTLHRASDVAFLEESWTPAAMDQAEDRAHRIGQNSAVTCWYFRARGTVDFLMRDLVDGKRETARAALGDR